VDGLELAGDFTILPAAAVEELQNAAHGARLERDALVARFSDAYRQLRVEAPGLTPESLADAVLAAASGPDARVNA
jgi:hypothetical protein